MSKIKKIRNWISGEWVSPENDCWLPKFNPHNGQHISDFAASGAEDVTRAVNAAENAFVSWSSLTPVRRGQYLSELVSLMKSTRKQLADCVARETGKPPQDAAGEVGAAILQGEFFAGEGMRLYGRTLTSSMPNKSSRLQREPIGVAGLIVPANTPIANIAWKVFPALVCGNTVVLKAAEDAPEIAALIAELGQKVGIPSGVFNVIQGAGQEAGNALVENTKVGVLSFTGSTAVGRRIAAIGGERLARVSLELGGKNPFVVCRDADIDEAVKWAALSSFSNAGQRCAAASRIYVEEDIYTEFVDALVDKAKGLKLGIDESADLGPLINKKQYDYVRALIRDLPKESVLCGGNVPDIEGLEGGFYILPTVLQNVPADSEIHDTELFAPVVIVYPVRSLHDAVEKSNATEYGLTAAIHTKNVDKAEWFAHKVRAGVVNINIGTYGSEPHMPFGGFGQSGNGTREPGVEALDVYSELKNISTLMRPDLV